MNCLAQEALLRYLHGDMGQEEMEASRHHMEQCQACRQAAEGLHDFATTLARLAAADPSLQHPDGEAITLQTFVAYLDHQLPARERAQVARHIAQCTACLDELQAAEQYLAAARTAPQTASPRMLARAAALGPSHARREWTPWWWQWRAQFHHWASMLAVPRLQWAVTLGVVVVAFLLGWGVRDVLHVPSPAPAVRTGAGPRSVGYGFGTSVPSQTLYTSPKGDVSAIEIKPSLREALANPAQAPRVPVRIRLLTDGTLILEEAPEEISQ